MQPTLTLVPSERHAEEQAAKGVKAQSVGRFVRELVERDEPGLCAATPEITRLAVEQELGRGSRFSAVVDDAVGVLRSSGVSAAELLRLALPRAQFLGNVMNACDRRLAEHGLRDEREDPARAARLLDQGRTALDGLSRIVVRGLSRWDAVDLDLFEALHRRLRFQGGDGLSLVLPNARGDYSAQAVDSLANSLETRWSALNDAPSLEFEAPRPIQNLKLSLVEAADEASEARAAVRAALESLERGAAIDRIAIVSLDLGEPFLEPLREQLALAGLPFVEPRGRPPIAGPKVHAALELMRQSHGPLGRDALIDILCLPELDGTRWFGPGAHETRHALLAELARLPLGVDRSRRELCEALAARADAADGTPRARLALSGLKALLADLEQFAAPAPRERLGRAWLELFGGLGLLTAQARSLALALAGVAENRPELLRALGDNAQGARALVTAIERSCQAARALGLEDQSVLSHVLLDEVEAALTGASQQGGAARAGALSVGRPHELSGLTLDLAVVCQASSASLDSGRAGAETVLGSELRDALPRGRRPPGARDQRRFTLLAVSAILARAAQGVVSYPRREGPGTTGPSRLFSALAAAGHPLVREPSSLLSPGARRVAPARAASADALRRARIEIARSEYFFALEGDAGPYTGRVPALGDRAGGSAERPLPLTAVERYARCPFLAYSGSLLRAARDETAGDAIGVRERGSLLHEALAHAFEATRGRWGTLDAGELEVLALDAARQFLFARGASALRRAGLGATLADVAAFIRWSLDHAEYAFFAGETGFGARHGWSALKLGPFFVSGRIDRIDASSDRRRLRIIDYKTGKRPSASELDEQLLQPWLYALKAGRELGAEHVEAGYLALNRRNPAWKAVYDGPLDGEAIQGAVERAIQSVERFRSGRVEPQPRDPRYCQRCDARDLCRRPLSAPAADGGNS